MKQKSLFTELVLPTSLGISITLASLKANLSITDNYLRNDFKSINSRVNSIYYTIWTNVQAWEQAYNQIGSIGLLVRII